MKENKFEVNLPKTNFPMKGKLTTKEPQIIKAWKEKKIYKKIQRKNWLGKKFSLPDGPPYANGHLHLGHVLNKVLKDFVIKYKSMKGFKTPYIPGWDCHGLPIELKVTKKVKGKNLNDKKIRELCRKEALHWIEIQKEEFQRLGILGDWEKPFFTMDPKYEAEEVRLLGKIHKKGLLYRGEKPVFWCTHLKTALAAAEAEYRDKESPSIFVRFFLKHPFKKLDLKKPTSFLIWTTTPWTLPANYAISVHPDFEYGLYDLGEERVILAKALKERCEKEFSSPLTLKESFKGKELEGARASHPFLKRDSEIVLGDHVTKEDGTGCVHTAPGHGLDDYAVGLDYDLPIKSPVTEEGNYDLPGTDLHGMNIEKANPFIIEKLQNSGHLVSYKKITHSYPYNPRSQTPLIFRCTKQWFIEMDKDTFDLRKKAFGAIKKDIHFVPSWGRQRMESMVEKTPDWCISRQRKWGVPIPVFYCTACEEPLFTEKIVEKAAKLMEKTGKGIEAYFDAPLKKLLPSDAKCSKCGMKSFKKGEDILDVWFDSGALHTAFQKKKLTFPADLYLEGSDQHRGWFQTSLLSSLAAYEKPPFKTLLTHGFVNDSKGHKMSKSKGNVISPIDIMKQDGAEMLRLWVSYENYGQDVTVGDEIFKRIKDSYRRFRNTLRYLLGCLHDFDPKKDQVPYHKMPPLDQWALSQLNEVIKKVNESYDEYSFFKVFHLLNQYVTVDVSSIYSEILKDRLYTGKKDGWKRRSSQTVFYHILENLTLMMAPILSFLSEEVYEYIPKKKKQSVFLEPFPDPKEKWDNPEILKTFEEVFKLKEEVLRKLEDMRDRKEIGSSLEATLHLRLPPREKKSFEPIDLREIFIVSGVKVVESNERAIEVMKAKGQKCPRCWNYSENLNKMGLCPKCEGALS